MTNDTSTLDGALMEVGELMATNLTNKGVIGASASDGLTTLSNKILDIPTSTDYFYIDHIERTEETLNIALPSKFELEFDIYPTSRSTSGGGSGCYMRIGSANSQNNCYFFGQINSAGKCGSYLWGGTESYYTDYTVLNEMNTFKLTYDGTTLTATWGSETKTRTPSITMSKILNIVGTSNNKLKSIRVKEL